MRLLSLRTTIAVGAIGVAILGAGCGAGGGEDDESAAEATAVDPAKATGTVTFESWSPVEGTTKQMVAAFKTVDSDVTIETTILNYPEYITDLKTKAAAGAFPDIVGLQPGSLTQLYRGKLLPLQTCAEQLWGSDWESKFYPIGVEQARLGNPDGDENFYALPILTQTINLWATIPLLEKAGLSAPPTTWAELKTAVEKLRKAGTTGFMLPAKDGWVRRAIYIQIANNVAPGLFYEAQSGEAEWTDAKLVEAMSWWERLFTEKIVQPGALGLDAYPSVQQAALQGKAPIFPFGAWWQQEADPTKADRTPLAVGLAGYEPFLFPTIPGGASESQLVGGIDVALGISRETKNPDAACAVLGDWIGGKGAQALINTFNDLPAYKGISPAKFENARQEQIWDKFTNEWMPAVKWQQQPESPEITTALEDATAAVASGQKSPAAAMQDVQEVQDELGA
jgi:raffinose/stachyose/melibiose transport system substrate-binding protein